MFQEDLSTQGQSGLEPKTRCSVKALTDSGNFGEIHVYNHEQLFERPREFINRADPSDSQGQRVGHDRSRGAGIQRIGFTADKVKAYSRTGLTPSLKNLNAPGNNDAALGGDFVLRTI